MAYKHVIRAKTKNLLDYSKFNPIWKTSGVINSNGYLSKPASLFNTSLFYPVAGWSGVLPDVSNLLQLQGTYTFSISSISVGDIYIMKYNADGTMNKQIGSLTNNKKVETLTFDELTYVDIKIRREIAVVVTGLMVQEGSTATPYTPYNYLQSNKRMIKVSNVCQLLDKSKYNLPHTESGLTFTAGTDGSIIVNGTCTSTVWANISLFNLNPEHTFLLIGCPGTNVNDVALYTADSITGDSKQWEEGRGSIVTGNYYKNKANYLYIRILTGYVCNNLTFKPQLYDLTEMYGAGNEPATVAEFRQKFPDELYPYSPKCWLTSYKSAVVCKTKNLFDVNNAVPYAFDTDNPDSSLIWLKDGIYTTRMNNYNIGSGLRIKDGLTLPAGTYVVSAKIVDFYNIDVFNIGFRYKDTESKWQTVNGYAYPSRVGVGDTIQFHWAIPEHADLRLYLNYQNNNGGYLTGYVSYKDIQVEQGSTTTSYVPYQHL